MKTRSLPILLLLILLASVSVLAQQPEVKRSTIIENFKGKPYYLHFVAQGETLSAIEKTYQVSREELLSENPFLQEGLKLDQVLKIPKKDDALKTENTEKPSGVAVEKPAVKLEPTQKPAETGTLYIVRKKETLYGISKKFNITIEELLKANPGMTELKEGMELRIPGPAKEVPGEKSKPLGNDVPADATIPDAKLKHIKVSQGQTIYSLSKEYGITVEEFIRLNPEVKEGLKADQTVRVPVAAGEKTESQGVNDRKPSGGAAQNPPEQIASRPVLTRQADSCYNPANSQKKYKIAILLPLALEEADSVLVQGEDPAKSVNDFKSFDFFQFYGGIKLAADSLEKMGFQAEISVIDADMEGDTLKIKKALRKNDLSKINLIIGPVYVKSFDVASRFAEKENVSIVNPLSRREKIIQGNPFVYKSQVSDESIAAGLARYIRESYRNAHVLIIRSDDKELSSMRTAFIRELSNAGASGKMMFKEINYAKESFQGVTKAIVPGEKNVLLFFSSNRALVPNFVSLLNNHGKNMGLTLFGMPGWKEMDLETEFLENLDYHEPITSFVDYDSDEVKNFIQQFRNAFGAEPLVEKQAYLGFDLGWYFFQAMMMYGEDFGPCLPNMNYKGLQTDFRFNQVNRNDGYENVAFRIIRLSDYKWVEVK